MSNRQVALILAVVIYYFTGKVEAEELIPDIAEYFYNWLEK